MINNICYYCNKRECTNCITRYEAEHPNEDEELRSLVGKDAILLTDTMDMYDFMNAVRSGKPIVIATLTEDRYLRAWSAHKSIDILCRLNSLSNMLYYLNGKYDTEEHAMFIDDYACEFYDDARDDDDMIKLFGTFAQ